MGESDNEDKKSHKGGISDTKSTSKKLETEQSEVETRNGMKSF